MSNVVTQLAKILKNKVVMTVGGQKPTNGDINMEGYARRDVANDFSVTPTVMGTNVTVSTDFDIIPGENLLNDSSCAGVTPTFDEPLPHLSNVTVAYSDDGLTLNLENSTNIGYLQLGDGKNPNMHGFIAGDKLLFSGTIYSENSSSVVQLWTADTSGEFKVTKEFKVTNSKNLSPVVKTVNMVFTIPTGTTSWFIRTAVATNSTITMKKISLSHPLSGWRPSLFDKVAKQSDIDALGDRIAKLEGK